MIYRRWSSKEELIADALRELTTDFESLVADDLYSLLLSWLRDFARTFSDPLHGRLLVGVLGELQKNPVFADVYADRVVRPRREALLARLTEAREAGELRPDADVEVVADLLGGALLLRRLPLGLPAAGERYAEELLETIWRGIARWRLRPASPDPIRSSGPRRARRAWPSDSRRARSRTLRRSRRSGRRSRSEV